MFRKNGHSPSEAFNETVEELTQSLIRLVDENGMDWMFSNCSAELSVVEERIIPERCWRSRRPSGGAEAGLTSAIFCSLTGSCKTLGIIPEEYLKEVFSALPDMTSQAAEDWTPAAWKARREKTRG